jgi:dihydrofolate synthase/folylpolyglutamate synthase
VTGPAGLPPPVALDDLLAPIAPRGIVLGLERMAAALAEGGHPERRFAAVQVAGTNGKGSICAFLHAILQAAGLRVGVYRSPHLVSWCERICLHDSWIAPEVLRADLERWHPLALQHQLTPFELVTAAAFGRFALEPLDLAVLEVGLGGRLDATTAHPRRPVIGFAAIGLDHREHLGDTLAAIAREKAGVLSAGAVAISGPQAPPVAAVLRAEAAARGADLRWVQPLPAPAAGGPALGLAGELQRSNGAVAVAMARVLAEPWDPLGVAARLGPALANGAIEAGLAGARWPGRLQRARWRGRPLLLDGAHNPHAAAALRAELDRRDPGPRQWLVGIQRTKDGPALLTTLLRPGDRALITPLPDLPAWQVADLAAARAGLARQLTAVADARQGLEQLMTAAAAGPQGPEPVICGSLHLLGALLPLLDAPDQGA